jgi:uncharacterized phage protein (TIGR02218 family)
VKTVTEGLGTGTLAVCWRILRNDGQLILGTQLDRDITIDAGDLAGTYRATVGITGSDIQSGSDLAVDNLEVEATRSGEGLDVPGLRAIDVEAGLYDAAEVTLFLVNWEDTTKTLVLRSGTLGAISRTAEGRYRTELRGLSQKLSQTVGRIYSITCDAELYDTRCKVSRAAHTFAGTVVSVTSRKQFQVAFGSPDPDFSLDGGEIMFTSGANDGYRMEIRVHDTSGITLFQAMAADIEPGDTFEAFAGCNKTKATCKGVFNNLVNFRGHGYHVPGMTEVMKVGGQGS